MVRGSRGGRPIPPSWRPRPGPAGADAGAAVLRLRRKLILALVLFVPLTDRSASLRPPGRHGRRRRQRRPALAAAQLGLALGSGTDLAICAADMILLRDDLQAVPDAISLARADWLT